MKFRQITELDPTPKSKSRWPIQPAFGNRLAYKIARTMGGTLSRGLSRIDKDAKEERNRKIFDMWMAYHARQEIAGRYE